MAWKFGKVGPIRGQSLDAVQPGAAVGQPVGGGGREAAVGVHDRFAGVVALVQRVCKSTMWPSTRGSTRSSIATNSIDGVKGSPATLRLSARQLSCIIRSR